MTQSYKDWHTPLSQDSVTLNEALQSLNAVQAQQEEVPLMVQLVENPKYRIPGFEVFHGAVDLAQHDRIHIALGRGLLAMDEAFTIGFTMGSTKKINTTEETLFAFIAKYFYPGAYQLDDDEITVFKDAVKLGYISACASLDSFDFTPYHNSTLAELRKALNLERDLLEAYYHIEKTRFPQSRASQRLLD